MVCMNPTDTDVDVATFNGELHIDVGNGEVVVHAPTCCPRCRTLTLAFTPQVAASLASVLSSAALGLEPLKLTVSGGD